MQNINYYKTELASINFTQRHLNALSWMKLVYFRFRLEILSVQCFIQGFISSRSFNDSVTSYLMISRRRRRSRASRFSCEWNELEWMNGWKTCSWSSQSWSNDYYRNQQFTASLITAKDPNRYFVSTNHITVLNQESFFNFKSGKICN